MTAGSDSAAGPAAHPPLTPGETQAERTRLAWRRTTLAVTLAVLLIGRLAIHDGLDALSALGLSAALASWVAFMWLTHRRIQAMAQRAPAAIGRTLPAVGVAMVVFAVIGIVLVAVGGVAG
jgi:uncharacterized membrane protein YidH (DUF202 family)